MTDIQLEINLDNKNPYELKIDILQRQLDQMKESMNKVRCRLFAELSEVKKYCATIQRENEILIAQLKKLNNQKEEWLYMQDDYLFKIAAC